MSKNTDAQRSIELIYELTQKSVKVSFTDDFTGMLTIHFNEYEHYHLGEPCQDTKKLYSQIRQSLASKLETEMQKENRKKL